MEESDIQLRAPVVETIINRPPHWLIRIGVSLIFAILLLILFASWIIKYPEIIMGEALVEAENPVVKEISLVNGKAIELFVEEGALVEKGASLLSIENPLQAEDYRFLMNLLYTLDSLDVHEAAKANFPLDTHQNFGSVQRSYNQLIGSLENLDQFYNRRIDSVRKSNLERQIKNYQSLVKISQNQIYLAQKEKDNAREKYDSDKKLLAEGVYSKMTFLEKESEYRSKLSRLAAAKQTQTQQKITLTDYQKQYEELAFNLEEEERLLTQEYQKTRTALESDVKDWQQSYLITADKAGEINFLTDLYAGKVLQAGEELIAIVPPNQNYYIRATILAQNFGKVARGQRVNIKLDNYNWQEFGALKGTVKTISQVPGLNGYLVKVELEELSESQARNIQLQSKMNAVAEIQTKDLRLIERIFYQMKRVFERKRPQSQEEE